MDYKELSQGAIFSCRVKCTYTEIYVALNNEFIKVFSIQKKDYNGVIGYGEKYDRTDRGFTPITLTNEAIRFIAYKAGFIDEQGNHIGIINNNTVLVDKKQYDTIHENQFAPAADGYIIPDKPIEDEDEVGYEVYTDHSKLTLIEDGDNVYVREVAIDCQVVSEEEVEIEDVIVEEVDKKNSKLIWIALGAAAALLL